MSKKPFAIVAAGLAGGLADILTAFAIYRPASPERILQAVASGLVGPAARDMGLTGAAIGLACHFAISIIFAGLYVVGAGYAPVLLRKPVLGGLTFGVFVYGVMNAIVVPLSLAPDRSTPPDHITLLGLMAHFFFGIALAVTAARVLRTPRV